MANNRGLDQIVTTRCIGECTGPPPDGRVSGSPRLMALLQQADSVDISLFLTDLQQGWVHGVLVSKTPVNGRSMWMWNTSYKSDVALANVLETAFKDKYNDIDSRDELLKKGEQLSRLVFAGTAAGLEAKAAFDQLVQESAQWQVRRWPGAEEPVLPLRLRRQRRTTDDVAHRAHDRHPRRRRPGLRGASSDDRTADAQATELRRSKAMRSELECA